MTSNFDFLASRFPDLFTHATQAESMAHTAPRASCFYARFTLERSVLWLYRNDPYLKMPYDNNLGALIHEQTFQDNLTPALFPKIRTIHKIGNEAAHNPRSISSKDSLRLVEDLFHFLYWLCRYYAPDGNKLAVINFDRALIPQPQQQADLSLQQLQELESKLSFADTMRSIAEMRQQQTEKELEALKAEIAALKQQNEAVADNHDYCEADTRRYLIDVLLREVGWDLSHPDTREYPVTGMPNREGKGYADYVLWGDDGKPLAVIEAKRTSKNPNEGKHQAKLYADCLEKQFQQRPVIFYSNGYEHWIWDDLTYPPREVRGFFKKEELERIIFRRRQRKNLSIVAPNPAIAGRSYQLEAIKRIGETFDTKARKALLVMATGTGKTRTAIALVDLLMRANWVKRVLFLADRKALLTQALRSFKSQLATVTAVDLTKDKNAATANVVLSTYPTIFNYISNGNGGNCPFGVGHFDLIIIDEAHRGIYRKYRELFDYFDGLIVGLTATPRSEVHRDTYRIFDLEAGLPTFAYELQDAIADGYLVPPQGITVPFKFLRQGITYHELTEAEREEYEEKFGDEDTGEIPDRVNAAAVNQWLFNIDTIDRAIELVMEKGLKVAGGDRLGKTMIFARNHDHAEFIVERFDRNYPQYKGKFAQVIDSHNPYAQSLLDDFSDLQQEPTIAVSVDMLDTGVDVPEVVNLVFFKPIYSRVKFNQAIGRGTRLCANLFGEGRDKDIFFIFDLCGNFAYFQQEIVEKDPKLSESLTEKTFKTRVELSRLLTAKGDSESLNLNNSLLDTLHRQVATMEKGNFLVRRHLATVEEFAVRERWNIISEDDRQNSIDSLAKLPRSLPAENELAKRFDILCLKLQLVILQPSQGKHPAAFISLRDKMRDLLARLAEKQNLPMVNQKITLIRELQEEIWWETATVGSIERVRLSLRDLINFIDRVDRTIVYTDFSDELGTVTEADIPIQQTGFSPYQYRKKVETYIRANQDHLTIAKLKRNLPLTDSDLTALEAMLFSSAEIESKERFEEVYGKKIDLKLFIRQLVGLDRHAAKQAFSRYLEGENLAADRIRFIETIIDYLTQNGVMNPALLYEPPFTDFHSQGVDGIFAETDADRIFALVRSFNETVNYLDRDIG